MLKDSVEMSVIESLRITVMRIVRTWLIVWFSVSLMGCHIPDDSGNKISYIAETK
jgi:hypothetical protein